MSELIADIKVLCPRPGEVVVCRCAVHLNREQTKIIADSLKKEFPDNRVLIVPPELALETRENE